jgi:colanic acid biosynthesis protein WcaH
MDVRAAVSTLESVLGNPCEGLPSDVCLFVSRITPLINVDLLILDNRGRTLLTWRVDELFGCHDSCPSDLLDVQRHGAQLF